MTNRLRIATYNLCNLGAEPYGPRLGRLAGTITGDLGGPDVLAVQEIAASAPPDPRGRVSADANYRALARAIADAGGPCYDYREIAPLAGHDGGQAGCDIRVGLLFNPARVEFIERGQAGPEDATGIRMQNKRASLTLSPGRIDPANPAFEGDPRRSWKPSRKALAAELRYRGVPFFLIVCHLRSMRTLHRRERDYAKKQRHTQAENIHRFAAALLCCDPGANVVVLGDMNDLPGSKTLQQLKGSLLFNLLETLPGSTCYTRRHGNQRQALDHILVSRSLRAGASVGIAHVNSDSREALRASDHDPVVAALTWPI